MIEVRQATEKDRGQIWSLLLDMAREIAIFPISLDRIRDRIDEVLDKGIALIVEDDGQAVGIMGLLGTPGSWYTEAPVVSDTFIYIRPVKRSLRAWGELTRAAALYAAGLGLPLVLSLYTVKDGDRKMKLFERGRERIFKAWGFSPLGGEFLARA